MSNFFDDKIKIEMCRIYSRDREMGNVDKILAVRTERPKDLGVW
jgi:hypothetical protein